MKPSSKAIAVVIHSQGIITLEEALAVYEMLQTDAPINDAYPNASVASWHAIEDTAKAVDGAVAHFDNHIFYTRTHLPSGRVYVGHFTEGHHPIFGEPVPRTRKLPHATKLTQAWNAQHPTTWLYTLVE